MSNAIEVSDADFQAEVVESSTPVLVDFWAAWCGPCKAIAPIVDELAAEYADKLKVTKLDVDRNPNTAGQFGVMSIPTLILFKEGKPAERLVGYMPKDQLRKAISKHVPA
ncbi:MAG: thioredoxin [Chloroflexi bacterium]|nr:thioredoxin [Chloroflexota bacterium]